MKRFRKAFVLAFCAPFLAAEAQVIFRIPQDGGPMPNYWSGTNCRASASADCLVEPIWKAELLLNGEQAYLWIASDPLAAPWSKAVKIMFDSSHFINGTPLEVKYRVWGLWTGTVYEHASAAVLPVKNRLMMFEDPDPATPDPVPTVQNLMTGKNYLRWPQDGPNWTKGIFQGTMYGSNVIFFAGHGSVASHTAASGPGMTPGLYETERMPINGSGLPPFNSTIYPQVNFCHLVACNCGDTNNFEKVLYPYWMGWGGPYLENQALLAYTCFTNTYDRAENADLIWQKLSLG